MTSVLSKKSSRGAFAGGLGGIFLIACTLDNPGFGEATATNGEPTSMGPASGIDSVSTSTATGLTGGGAETETSTASTVSPPTSTTAESDGTVTGGTTTGGTTTGGTTSGDEEASTGVDDGFITLIATKSYDPSVWSDGQIDLGEAHMFELPQDLPVMVGNAGNHGATLSYGLGGDTVECDYVGGASVSKPMMMTAQWELGLSYVQKDGVLCDNGKLAGDIVEADVIALSIDNEPALGGP